MKKKVMIILMCSLIFLTYGCSSTSEVEELVNKIKISPSEYKDKNVRFIINHKTNENQERTENAVEKAEEPNLKPEEIESIHLGGIRISNTKDWLLYTWYDQNNHETYVEANLMSKIESEQESTIAGRKWKNVELSGVFEQAIQSRIIFKDCRIIKITND